MVLTSFSRGISFFGVAVALTLSGCSGSSNPAASSDPSAPAVATSSVATAQPSPSSTAAASVTPSTKAATAPRVDANSAPTTVPATVKATEGVTIDTPEGLGITTLPADVTVTEAGITIVDRVRPDIKKIKVYDSIDATTARMELDNPGSSGEPLVFTEDARNKKRALVLLPVRPNGSTGWIELGDVESKTVNYSIEVSLSKYTITVRKGSTVVLQDKIGVGKGTAPTPKGRYYITKLLRSPNPDGLYGPYAYGLSGFSETLTKERWNGNEPILGLHGTNRPELLGGEVSNGCIRMSNANITKLAKLLPLGVPVVVTA